MGSMKAAIVVGSRTSHGGVVEEGEPIWQIEGRAAHLEGMTHYCPLCQKRVTAIAGPDSMRIMGRRLILEGDKASCGAVFLSNQVIVKADPCTAPYNPSPDGYDEQYVLKTSEGEILAYTPYTITCSDGQIIKGTTDGEGKTQRVYTRQSEKLEVTLGE